MSTTEWRTPLAQRVMALAQIAERRLRVGSAHDVEDDLSVPVKSRGDAAVTHLQFSTRGIPQEKCRDIIEEAYAAHSGISLDFPDDRPIAVDMSLRALPSVHVSLTSTSPFRMTRKAANNGNGVGLVLARTALGLSQAGRGSMELQPGDGRLLLLDRPYGGQALASCSMLSIAMPREALAPGLAGLDRAVAEGLAATPELRLLASYVASLTGEAGSLSAAAETATAAHILDLANLVLGARGDAAAIAGRRGQRAARLAAVKKDIHAHLTRSDLTQDKLAARHGITSRYIRALFEAEGTNFATYVLEQRLAQAWRHLSDPYLAASNIVDIAERCGFADLSWFNKTFRRRYGMTPGEARETAMRLQRDRN
jgi:AraC-like DNA-binding protein